jgi:acyl-CoA thioester hydrolase
MNWPIQVQQPVQWGDMDVLGHVNNSRYFTWFETARIALFEQIGLKNAGTDLTTGPILAFIECTFMQPVHYPADIVCTSCVRSIGNTSFVLGHGVMQGDKTMATGDGVCVLIDYRTGAKVPIAPKMRAALEGLKLP